MCSKRVGGLMSFVITSMYGSFTLRMKRLFKSFTWVLMTQTQLRLLIKMYLMLLQLMHLRGINWNFDVTFYSRGMYIYISVNQSWCVVAGITLMYIPMGPTVILQDCLEKLRYIIYFLHCVMFHCSWNRSMQVRFVCAETRAMVTSITELSTCKYAVTVQCPLLCKHP